ncbi:MAG TPA: RluA family pseudouridine synthase, partial [Acidobacteriota bacterium]|nr:RluA family pseudouridine synthase [Acidobacteriota bacterium]
TSNRTLRQMLSRGRVSLNGRPCMLAREPVKRGDEVRIGESCTPHDSLHGLEIIFEDEALIVIKKPAGLLTVANEHERERTAYAYLRSYLRRRRPTAGKPFIVHRLDKFVSGVLTFAKSEGVKQKLQAMFRRHDVDRKYWAIVEGRLTQERGTIRSYLAENRSGRMSSTVETDAGKHAVTHWRVLRRLPHWTTVEVTLETGRKNQIRAHLSEMGNPIVGDKSYGSTIDPFGRIALHAYRLGFAHPTDGKPLLFETEPPAEFRKYLPSTSSSATSSSRRGSSLTSQSKH